MQNVQQTAQKAVQSYQKGAWPGSGHIHKSRYAMCLSIHSLSVVYQACHEKPLEHIYTLQEAPDGSNAIHTHAYHIRSHAHACHMHVTQPRFAHLSGHSTSHITTDSIQPLEDLEKTHLQG